VKTKTRDEWMKVFDGTDACVAPVLSMDEAPKHPHNAERKTFVESFGVTQPNAAPRFSRTAGAVTGAPAMAGKHSLDVLESWGIAADRREAFLKAGAVAQG
jgi:alpha-methylacyl-CoA racemase